MIEHPRPTRAEASDVANGVWDGADAVMLSGETASGRFPVQSIQMMDRIIREAESTAGATRPPVLDRRTRHADFPEVTADAACRAAQASGAVLISCFTLSGTTALLVSRFRPGVPIVGFSPDQDIRRRLALYWGVVPRVMEPVRNTDMVADLVSERLLEEGLCKPGDRIVLVHGSPVGVAGQTNSIRLHEIPHPADLSARRYRVPI
jgi:pyruvate kinase